MTDTRKQEVAKLTNIDELAHFLYEAERLRKWDGSKGNYVPSYKETAEELWDALYKLPDEQQVKEFLFEAERRRIWDGHNGVYVPSYLDTARGLLAFLQQDTKDTCPKLDDVLKDDTPPIIRGIKQG
jgi:hypothetical protein